MQKCGMRFSYEKDNASNGAIRRKMREKCPNLALVQRMQLGTRAAAGSGKPWELGETGEENADPMTVRGAWESEEESFTKVDEQNGIRKTLHPQRIHCGKETRRCD